MYNRVLLKLSGEALKGSSEFGIDPRMVIKIADEIKSVHDSKISIAIVVGGGNIWRGKTAEDLGMERVQADQMGMLATMMNGLALQDALESKGVSTRVMSAIGANQVAEPYIRRRAIRHLEKERVVIFVGGSGIPYFSTDTTAAIRSSEINADVVLMAKNGIEGVYDCDPKTNKSAILYKELTHQDILMQGLLVMDSTAASVFKENKVEVVVFNMNKKGNILRAAKGEKIGTKIDC